jgi:hypothetical protein
MHAARSGAGGTFGTPGRLISRTSTVESCSQSRRWRSRRGSIVIGPLTSMPAPVEPVTLRSLDTVATRSARLTGSERRLAERCVERHPIRRVERRTLPFRESVPPPGLEEELLDLHAVTLQHQAAHVPPFSRRPISGKSSAPLRNRPNLRP